LQLNGFEIFGEMDVRGLYSETFRFTLCGEENGVGIQGNIFFFFFK